MCVSVKVVSRSLVWIWIDLWVSSVCNYLSSFIESNQLIVFLLLFLFEAIK